MAKIGVGIIGCGGMGAALAQGLAGLEAAQVVAAYDESADKAKELAARHGAKACPSLTALVGDEAVGAVAVASPQFAHAAGTVAAARAGKHVFCEKPMAVTLEDCDAMIAACADAGVKLMIGQVCRYHGVHGKVRELVKGGELGRAICMTVHRLGGPWGGAYAQGWRLQREMCGGTLLEVNAHEIDFLRWVCGDVEAVYAAGGLYADKRLDYPDLTLVTLHFAGGAKGLLHSGQVSTIGGYGGRVDLERGSLTFPAIWGADAGIHVCKAGEKPSFIPASDLKVEDPVGHELRDFIESIANDTEPPVPGAEGRANVEVGVAAYQSIECGETVPLPL